jgi:hypothetical protein
MQPDPLWAAYPSESPYRYGHNAPLNYSDASGLEEMQEIFEGCPGISYDDGGSGGPRYTPMDVNPLYEIGTDQGYLYDHPGGVTVVEDDNGDILVTYTGLASPLGPGRATTMRMPGIRSTLKTPEAGVTIEGGGYVSGKANGNTSGRAGTMMGQEVSSIHGRPTGIHGGGYNDVNNDGGGGFSSVGPAVGGDAPRGFLSWLSRLFTRFSWKSAGALSTASALTNASVIDKLQRYVLNFNHPSIDAKSKAKWFKEALGYTLENMEQLAKQIVFNPNTAVQTKITEHGIKYNQVIPITGANGRTIDVVFAWIKNNDGVVRFVTAIPTQKGK